MKIAIPNVFLSLLSLLSLHFASAIAGAQARTVAVPYRATCAQCSVTLTPVASIGKTSDSVQLGEASTLARDSRGLYYAASSSRNSVAVYDSTGRLLRTVGQAGARPGEFGTPIRSIYISKDSLYVFDSDRMTVFAPSHKYVRVVVFQVIPQYAAAIAPNGHIYFAANIRTTGREGLPAHHADASGKVLQSFGAAAAAGRGGRASAARGGPSAQLRPFITTFATNSLWYWDSMRYRFEEWGLDGKSRTIVQVNSVPWLATAASARDGSAAPTPGATIELAGVRNGLLFVNAILPQAAPSGNRARGRGNDANVRYMLEIIDPQKSQLLHSQRVEAPLTYFPDSDRAYGMIRDAAGNVSFKVWRVDISGLPK